MPKKFMLFLNYRRKGGLGHANSLRTGLEKHFWEGAVFQDNFSLRSGEEWEKKIEEGVRKARVFLTFIHGDDWFTATRQVDKYNTVKLLFDEGDWVRKEIRIVLERIEKEGDKLLLIPLVVKDTKLWPQSEAEVASAVPEDIARLFKRQYETFDPDDLEDSIERLAERIVEVFPELKEQAAPSQPEPPAQVEVPGVDLPGASGKADVSVFIGNWIAEVDWGDGDSRKNGIKILEDQTLEYYNDTHFHSGSVKGDWRSEEYAINFDVNQRSFWTGTFKPDEKIIEGSIINPDGDAGTFRARRVVD